MRKLLYSPWQTLSIPSALTPIGQLHQSPPSPVPEDLGSFLLSFFLLSRVSYECVMSYMNEFCHTCSRVASHTSESRQTYQRVAYRTDDPQRVCVLLLTFRGREQIVAADRAACCRCLFLSLSDVEHIVAADQDFAQIAREFVVDVLLGLIQLHVHV